MRRPAAVLAVTTSLLACLAGTSPAQAAARAASPCVATVAADALLMTTVAPASSSDLIGFTTAPAPVKVDRQGADPSGVRMYHLAPGTVLDVRVAQGMEVVTRTSLAHGAWVPAAAVAADRSFERCVKRVA